MKNEPEYPIRVVSRRTGLSPHVIRIWERRYGAVTPQRTDTNRRLYSEADIDRLRLLRDALRAGHSIGQVADRSLDELLELIGTPDPPVDAWSARASATAESGTAAPTGAYLDRCRAAAAGMDRPGLERALLDAAANVSLPVLLEDIVSPLLHCVGADWRDGALRVAHEHMVSAVLRDFLAMRRTAFDTPEGGPALVLTTPKGQRHELGALMAALIAAADGWRDLYLGPNLPADEIAGAVADSNARAIALSIVYPSDDPLVGQELMTLRQQVGPGLPIIVGGHAASAYRPAVDRVEGRLVDSLAGFRRELDDARLSSIE